MFPKLHAKYSNQSVSYYIFQKENDVTCYEQCTLHQILFLLNVQARMVNTDSPKTSAHL